MTFQNKLQEQLHSIHLQRNNLVWVVHLSLVIISTIFHREKLFTTPLWWISLLTITFGLALRSLFFHRFYEQWKSHLWSGKFYNYLAIILVTGGWFLHFSALYLTWGPESYRTSNTLLFIGGVVSGATVTLAAHLPSYILFSTIMCGGPICLYLLDRQLEEVSLVITIVLFYVFNIYQAILGHRQLCDSIKNEIHAKEEKDRLQRLIDTVPGFVGIMNKDLEVIMANQATIFLYPDIIGKKIGNLDPNSNWEKTVIDFAGSDRQSMVTEQHTKRDGMDIHALLNVHKSENTIVIVSIVINELVEARHKLKEQEAKAQYSARLASLGEMAAGIAHEVNNPLTIIQGASSVVSKLIDQEPLDKATLKMLADKIIKTTDRISRTIKSLRSLSRKGDNDPVAEVNFQQLLETCLDICRQRFSHHNIELILPSGLQGVKFFAREVQLSQVLVNLLGNSIDAVKPLDERWVKIDYRQTERCFEIFVIDSGTGIEPEIVSKIMDPFFTTKDVNEGTGLGLSISKTIIESHGGELTYMSQTPNTTFRILLPQIHSA